MICPICKAAGDLNTRGDWYAANHAHLQCTDRDCSCQHGVGKGWIARA